MTQGRGSGGDTEGLLERLKQVRRHVEGQPEQLRREALEQALEEVVGGLSRQEADRTLGLAREALIREARDRDQTIESLRDRIRSLEDETVALQAEKNRLARETSGLGAGETPSGGSSTTRIRDGLRRVTKNERVKSDSLGIPEAEVQFFGALRALLDFAFKITGQRDELLRHHGVGSHAKLGTRLMSEKQKEFRDLFLACLDDREGSLRELRSELKRIAVFPWDLNEALLAAASQGTAELLTQLDSEPILEKHAGAFGGVKWENAFKELSTIQEDLRNRSPTEVWEMFFASPLRNSLEAHAKRE